VRAADAAGNLSAYSNVASASTQGGQLYYIVPDHLNTPRMIANQQGTTVWKWEQQEPFGATPPNDNPSGLGSFDFPVRFPGQYADRETGLFYNYHRNYASDLDRYVESDPIGIRGGINVYVYVLDPLTQIDPFGLMGSGGGAGIPGPRPGTGNIWPGAPRQNFICDFPFVFLESNPCTQRCCVKHDECFARNGCNWSSWFGNVFIGGSFPCRLCNSEAVQCVRDNWGKTSCPPACGAGSN
jgi:RHS repeat-associated protein